MALEELPSCTQTAKTLSDADGIFARAFHASGTILLISSLSTGRFIEVNEAFERTLGYRRDEVLGRDSVRLRLWESQKERAAYVQLLQSQGKVRNLEVRLRAKSGASVVGLLSGDIADFGGEPCILSVVNDITDRKRAAEEIEVLHTDLAAHALALEVANEELEAFSYTVSHDLRKPLTAISGYCQVLQSVSMSEDDAACDRYLEEILSGTVRMSQLIDTLLQFSRLNHNELHRERVDMTSLATHAVEELRASEPQRVVEINIARGVVADGDATLLRVVLDNLIGNAWKYSANRAPGAISFGCAEIDGRDAYFVRDNGVGFDMAGADRLFTAFHRQQGAERFNGFGIGLATVKRIVNRHGGRVWAEGEPGKGATFYFTTS